MAKYTSLDQESAINIAQQYGLDFLSLTSIEEGSENSNYLLDTEQGKFSLTLFEVKNNAEVERIAELLIYLQNKKFPAPQVRPTLKDKNLSGYEGKPILLKEYIEGKTEHDLSENQLAQVGAMLANLHTLGAPDFLPKAPPLGLDWMQQLNILEADLEFETWLEKSVRKIKSQMPKELPIGLVHADLFSDNMLQHKGKLAAFLDFEEACEYFLVFDIGMAILGCCRNEIVISKSKSSALVSGYQSVRRLTSEEIKALPLFIYYAAASTAAWRYWKFNISAPIIEKSRKYLEMIQIADGLEDGEIIFRLDNEG
jgi:homoserine kinase type II